MTQSEFKSLQRGARVRLKSDRTPIPPGTVLILLWRLDSSYGAAFRPVYEVEMAQPIPWFFWAEEVEALPKD